MNHLEKQSSNGWLQSILTQFLIFKGKGCLGTLKYAARKGGGEQTLQDFSFLQLGQKDMHFSVSKTIHTPKETQKSCILH